MLSRSRERDRAQALAVPGAAPQAEGGDHSVACPDAAVTSGPGLRGAGIGTRLRPSSLHCTSFLKEAERTETGKEQKEQKRGAPRRRLSCEFPPWLPAWGSATSSGVGRQPEGRRAVCSPPSLVPAHQHQKRPTGPWKPAAQLLGECVPCATRHRGAAWGAAQSPSVCAHWQQAGHHTP